MSDYIKNKIFNGASASDVFDSLLVEIRPRPIQSDKELDRIEKWYMKLVSEKNRTVGHVDMIRMLALLIQDYHGERYPKAAPRIRLRELMNARSLNQSQLAKCATVPQPKISEVLSGKIGISKSLAKKFASYFDVPTGFFID